VAEFMQESIVFLLRVQCRRKESSRSLSHLLMSFLLRISKTCYERTKSHFQKVRDVFEFVKVCRTNISSKFNTFSKLGI